MLNFGKIELFNISKKDLYEKHISINDAILKLIPLEGRNAFTGNPLSFYVEPKIIQQEPGCQNFPNPFNDLGPFRKIFKKMDFVELITVDEKPAELQTMILCKYTGINMFNTMQSISF